MYHKKKWNPHYENLNGIKKRQYQTNTGEDKQKMAMSNWCKPFESKDSDLIIGM